jgi:lipopolysaccharide transport system ATP-binding protein
MKPIIQVSNLSKRYRIGRRESPYGTLRDSLTNAFRAPMARRNRRDSTNETIWALKDINLEVLPGEVVGVIGRNGAGKSTFLKILSRITEPTSGRVELYGRVGSLLEVGTGFHPELTGRENIFLNGAILGMGKKEIRRKFDEITAFSELERFLDTPVKFYSSGMYMRLAFAVAAHLEPEILLVDEVLAVGDAQFQNKCLGKMGDLAKEGRTLLFVSHNMTAINLLCPRAIMLAEGSVVRSANTSEVVAEYLKTSAVEGGELVWKDRQRSPGNEKVRLHGVRIISGDKVTNNVDIDKDVTIEIDFWNYVKGTRNLCVDVHLQDDKGTTVLTTSNSPNANALVDNWFYEPHEPGLFRAVCTVPGNFLNEGRYHFSIYIVTLGPLVIELEVPQALSLNVFDTGVMREPGGGTGRWPGVVRMRLPWRTQLLEPLNNGDGPSRN